MISSFIRHSLRLSAILGASSLSACAGPAPHTAAEPVTRPPAVAMDTTPSAVRTVVNERAVFPPAGQTSLASTQPVVVGGSYLSPLIEIFGDVSVGRGVFVASNTLLRADPGTRICIGSATNLQDNILLLAVRNVPVPVRTDGACGVRSSSLADSVSVAHQATVSNSHLGKFTFIGFRALLENAVIEDGAFVLHGAVVRNVRIPAGRLVPVGAVITTQEQADALPKKSDKEAPFQMGVLGVNAELASGYSDLYTSGGYDLVTRVSPGPRTSWSRGVWPTIAPGVVLREFSRVVGDVRLGANTVVGRRTSIRADEGAPIIIGAGAVIRDRVTFHALKGTSIRIGDGLRTEANIVFHGPLVVGDRLTVADDVILYDSTVGNDVQIGAGAIVVGVKLRDGVSVPDGMIVQTQGEADALSRAGRR